MPDTEEILCVAAGAAVLAVATNARLLRLFTPMGTQRQVISLAGPVVSLAAFNTAVLAVYHSTDPGYSDQHLAMDIIAMNGRQVRSKTVPMPLTPSSKLAWLGTTDMGSPCAYDNSGILRMYDVASGVWMPICDTNTHSKGASDSWFIVSVSEATQKVRAILCRGASFPATAPKPIVAELGIQIPLCDMDTEKSQYEEQLVRWAHTTADVDVKTARETALKLFAVFGPMSVSCF
uniref:WDHD1/CFT4 second beta-propeller domain-containing protein n=1 Tax=Heliothis virescens TaxID=7102 RepID=A0A2A4IX35_HELVI